MNLPATLPLARLWPRFGALVYEGVLLFGITFLAGWIFVVLAGDASRGAGRHVFQAWLAVVMGGYFVACWRRSGQTLAMKTWGLRVVRRDGTPLSAGLAAARYLAALAGLLAGGAGFLWAAVDRERQFLHDRLLGTRIVRVPI